ncbi:P1 family peptidase [Streptomyces sp. B21-105]|uniref:DmpA family aminopeptidase n=1 Tax=Streptomyces sp. B21-105 TaxID=3039417 RepID=UPI002FEF4B6A
MGERALRVTARQLGVVLGQLPTGPRNTITDVPGVLVGHETIIEGQGAHRPGIGPVRTGVTVIQPHPGDTYLDRVSAAVEWFNGFGECLGAGLVHEFGLIIGPITLTNSFNVYRVADALQDWSIRQHPEVGIDTHGLLCLVAECSDDYLNDIQGRHVHAEHVERALGAVTADALQGAVGAGTGMEVYGFKGGIGTSSRVVDAEDRAYTVGVLALANHGIKEQLTILGVPVGRELERHPAGRPDRREDGSCVLVVATDAPLLPHQLRRLARRSFLGMARTGATARNGSGDLAIAFSTTNRIMRDPGPVATFPFVPDFHEDVINPLFSAVCEASEEAIVNALFTAESMTGRDGHHLEALPIEPTLAMLRKHGQLAAHA